MVETLEIPETPETLETPETPAPETPETPETSYILFFDSISLESRPKVGGKNAALGEMYQHLQEKGIKVPYGFAITVDAYSSFIKFNKLNNLLDEHQIRNNPESLRKAIEEGTFPDTLRNSIIQAYKKLSLFYKESNVSVAIRSSSISEDSESSSFAGQQDTYLNIQNEDNLLMYVKKCFASLFTDRVLCYRESLISEETGAQRMSVCVQRMVRSDLGSSGVLFTADTESGFRDAIIINASYGLGETIVGGIVDPDEYTVFKKTMTIIDKKLGSKSRKMVYSSSNDNVGTMLINTKKVEQETFCLDNKLINKLSHWGVIIEDHYASLYPDKEIAVDIEWAWDGVLQELFIVQARLLTTLKANTGNLEQYILGNKGQKLISGIAVGDRIAYGVVRKLCSIEDIKRKEFNQGDVLVVDSTTPDWEPVMKKASAIITNRGGRTCHAAIIAREQGIAAIVGTGNSLEILEERSLVTVSCAEGEIGNVYNGKAEWEITTIDLQILHRSMQKNRTKIMFNLASPELAFKTSLLPNYGIGLAREEFIINNFIKIHPLALLNYDTQDQEIKDQIDKLIVGYSPIEYYKEKLAFGIAKIAAAFYPNDVIVRFSDFKSNEYRNLLGGIKYEPTEENPMIGWRGASRYYSKEFSEAFGLECQAIKRVREEMKLHNVVVMIPFCRTPDELLKVYKTMETYGLKRGLANLRVFLMAEVPSNIILADEFSKHIDGFSIGSNDLTQLLLGLDRDSHLVSHIYDERNVAVKQMIRQLIKIAKKNNVKCGICGQAPSDYESFFKFLIEEDIDSISITADSLPKIMKYY